MYANSAFTRLLDHLAVRSATTDGRAAAVAWGAAEPALTGIGSPLEALARCRRGEPWAAGALAALVRLAGADGLAAMVVLGAVVPGLAGAARSPALRGAGGPEGVEADLVAAAWEVVSELGGTTLAWPAATIVSRARDRVRSGLRAEARRRAREAGEAPLGALAAPCGRPVLEELAGQLAQAARRHPERRAGLALILATRVWGYAPEELARAGGEDVRAVRARRARAERALVAGERALVAGAGTGRARWA